MKKKLVFITCILMIIGILTGCGSSTSEDATWDVSAKTNYYEFDDGWVYYYEYKMAKNEEIGTCKFYGVDLRHGICDENGNITLQTLENSDNADIQSDMKKINELLHVGSKDLSQKQLLELSEDDIDLDYIDSALFISLVNGAHSALIHSEGNYDTLPDYDIFQEKEFKDGYKFQVGYINEIGCIDIIDFDVIYENGDQLTDCIYAGNGTDDMITVNTIFGKMAQNIVVRNDLFFNEEDYSGQTIGGLDFTRLYTLLHEYVGDDLQ